MFFNKLKGEKKENEKKYFYIGFEFFLNASITFVFKLIKIYEIFFLKFIFFIIVKICEKLFDLKYGNNS